MKTIRRIWRGLRTVLAGVWWVLEDGSRVLYACRAPALIVAAGAILIAETDQARDMVLITAHDATAWGEAGLVACVLAWAMVSWFWSRLTLDMAFASPAPPRGPPWRKFMHAAWVDNIPRLIGAVAIWSVAVAFFRSAAALRLAHSDASTFYEARAWACVVAGLIFYVIVVVRRPVLRWLASRRSSGNPSVRFSTTRPQYRHVHHVLGRTGLCLLVISLIFSPGFSCWFWVEPVEAAAFFGDAVRAVLFGLALMVSVLGALVLFGEHFKLPMFSGVLVAAVLIPLIFSDNHDVRLCRDGLRCADLAGRPDKTDLRMSLSETFQKWWKENEGLTKRIDTKGGPDDMIVPPMIVVAAAGGASRSAYWTTQILGELAAREPDFVRRLFMISGVSGGSLGATIFRSLVEEDRRINGGDDSHRLPEAAERGGKFVEHDFLGPAMATGLYVDLPLAPFSFWRDILPSDRAVGLEKAWEHAWDDQRLRTASKDPFTWSEGFIEIFGKSRRPWPILALNGTSVEKGKRVITSNVRFWEGTFGWTMSQPENRYDVLSMLQSDVPISTAVTMSARFPVISPSGGLRDRDGKSVGRVVDGGLFENFGALTVDEVVRYVAHRIHNARNTPVVPIVILISSDPTLDPLMSYEKQYGTADPLIATARSIPDCESLDGETPASPIPMVGHTFNECPYRPRETAQSLLDPALALYTGRTARGESVAASLLGRLKDLNRSIYEDLVEKIADDLRTKEGRTLLPPTPIYLRMGGTEEAGFFHFRQCRIDGRKSPTMSWHNSERGRETMRIMTGLGGDHDPRGFRNNRDTFTANQDICGNAAEFFRLCVKLARVAEGLNDGDARTQCAQRWPAPQPEPSKQVVGASGN
jgi:hypothetical protein